MLDPLRKACSEHLAKLTHQRYTIGASLFRICAGLTILYQYLITYPWQHFLYGLDGIVPYDWFRDELTRIGSFSLYALPGSALVFEGIYHLSMAITLLWMLGWHTRLMTPLTWVCLWSLHARNPSMWDAGDNLVRIMLLYACFANLGAHAALEAQRRRGAMPGATQGLLHNAAILMCALQLCLVYGTAGLAKVRGELWQNGTALYHILQVDEFAWSGYGAAIYPHDVLVTLLTYSTVAFQLSFPFLLFGGRHTRRIALAGGIAFHLGIAVILGLHTFSAFLISIELMFISDQEYLAVRCALRRLWRFLVARTGGDNRKCTGNSRLIE